MLHRMNPPGLPQTRVRREMYQMPAWHPMPVMPDLPQIPAIPAMPEMPRMPVNTEMLDVAEVIELD